MMNYKEIKNNPDLSIEEVASILLKRSCESARDRCKKGKGKYKDIRCDLTPSNLRVALIKDERFWRDWVSLTEEWVNGNLDSRERPTLDRIDEKGHYDVDNIQALPHWKNTSRATAKKCIIVTFNKNFQIEIRMILGLGKVMKKLGITRHEVTLDYANQVENTDYLFFDSQPELPIGGLSLFELSATIEDSLFEL